MEFLKSDSRILLQALDLQDWEKVISIKEDSESDGNFLITHIMKHVLEDDNKGLCLVTLQHSPSHYQHIGKRLNFNFTEKINEGRVNVIDPMKWIADEIGSGEEEKKVLTRNTEEIAKNLFDELEKRVKELLAKKTGLIYVMVDNLSILLDMGLDIRHALAVINVLLNFDERVYMVINVHVANGKDQNLVTAMGFISDVIMSVEALKTGKSLYVTGVLTIQRVDVPPEMYHYKATDKGVKVFRPGEVVNNLV